MARLGHPCQHPVHQPGHVAKGSSRLHMPEEHDLNQNGDGDGDGDGAGDGDAHAWQEKHINC